MGHASRSALDGTTTCASTRNATSIISVASVPRQDGQRDIVRLNSTRSSLAKHVISRLISPFIEAEERAASRPSSWQVDPGGTNSPIKQVSIYPPFSLLHPHPAAVSDDNGSDVEFINDPIVRRSDLPKWSRRFISYFDAPMEHPAAASTIDQPPLLRPPVHDPRYRTIDGYLSAFSETFAIHTPLKAAAFRETFQHHPNQPLIDSVILGITEGFWSGDGMLDRSREPVIHRGPRLSAEHQRLMEDQLVKDQRLGRFSGPLPAMPLYTSTVSRFVQEQREKSRIINNFSSPLRNSGVIIENQKPFFFGIMSIPSPKVDPPVISSIIWGSRCYISAYRHPRAKRTVPRESAYLT